MESIRLLGTENLDNYCEELIVKLYENYSQHSFIEKLFEKDQGFFLEFAKVWPTFMRNNAIMTQLTKVDSAGLTVGA
jgi:predicted metalloendopeptidase